MYLGQTTELSVSDDAMLKVYTVMESCFPATHHCYCRVLPTNNNGTGDTQVNTSMCTPLRDSLQERSLKVDPLPGLPFGIFVVGDAVALAWIIVCDDSFVPLLSLLWPEPPAAITWD